MALAVFCFFFLYQQHKNTILARLPSDSALCHRVTLIPLCVCVCDSFIFFIFTIHTHTHMHRFRLNSSRVWEIVASHPWLICYIQHRFLLFSFILKLEKRGGGSLFYTPSLILLHLSLTLFYSLKLSVLCLVRDWKFSKPLLAFYSTCLCAALSRRLIDGRARETTRKTPRGIRQILRERIAFFFFSLKKKNPSSQNREEYRVVWNKKYSPGKMQVAIYFLILCTFTHASNSKYFKEKIEIILHKIS